MISQLKPALSIAALALLVLPLAGQTPRPVQCRFVALNEVPPPLSHVVGEKGEVLVKLMRSRITEPLECFAVDGKLRFLDQATSEPLAAVSIPSSVKKATLIFVNVNPKGKPSWKIFPVEDSPEKFPPGGTHVVNLHADDIRFKLGPVKELLKPQQSKGFEMPEERDDFNMAPVVFQFKNKRDEWVNGKETSYRFLPGMRYLLVAYIDSRSRRPRVMTFKDPIRPVIPPAG
jgi:hypothetical protein